MMAGPRSAAARRRPDDPDDPDDLPLIHQKITPGTVRRIFPYLKSYRWALILLLITASVNAVVAVANPLMLGLIIDDGILRRRVTVVVALALALVGLAVLSALSQTLENWCSARIGQGIVFDLRTKVFNNIQQQPLAFFTRAQTGSLVSRLSTDVVGAQQAVTTLLSQTVSTSLTLALAVAAMFYLSWQISIIALAIVPLFIFPGRLVGRTLQRLTREQMQLNAHMSSLMNERFNVAGAMLAKLYGRPDKESKLFENRAGRIRDISILQSMYGQALAIVLSMLSALTLALAFGLGGVLVIHHVFQLGVVVALTTLLNKLYGPVNQLSGIQVSVLTALVSFDRIFEVLDLKPQVVERRGAITLPAAASGNGSASGIEFDHVSFRYPSAREVSLASLEAIALPTPERPDGALVLRDISFRVPAGKLTALVGPSGAGKTTITHLVPRLYDPTSGTVRINDHDIRDLTLLSVRDTVGVVTQDAHLYHDTIRANLLYTRPDATEEELIEACKAARIWELISSLPDTLDTVVGDRGFRLSGGEKQRVALARLLLKAPKIVVLDEATAHLDSESEAAIQRALKTALAGRTSLVIAHRLSTIREADQILVVDDGQILQRGTHEDLLASGGLYADLYHTQFAQQATHNGERQDH